MLVEGSDGTQNAAAVEGRVAIWGSIAILLEPPS